MERSLIDSKTRDWYSVSVDTLRAWGLVLVLGGVLAGVFFGYRYWEGHDMRRRASDVIAESRALVGRIQGSDLLEDLRGEYQSAVENLNGASDAFAREEFASALELGRRSRTLLRSIVEATGGDRGGVGQAQFLSVQGRVEYRRGDGGTWQGARARVVLYTGDHVKTGAGGSAEIMFRDGTLYTARPDTQLIISRSRATAGTPGEQAIRMDYGWVNLNTARRGGKVATPEAEARVAGDSEAMVTYDAASEAGRFAAFRGEMEVAAGGEDRRIRALEQVVQREGRLAETESLPEAPTPLEPEDDLQIHRERTRELVLSWGAVDRARAYALQVSRSHLFVDNVIDVTGRQSTRATLGLQGEGSFVWRVAALGPGGDPGPWSPVRSFRVSSYRGDPAEADREPPPLELEQIESYGSIFIVGGRTEPGAAVEINGEPVQVAADGSFTKTIQITKEGWSFVEVRARDAEGNESLLNPRVFVEIQ
ncbi:MAG: FecR domain-containing protein [Thermoanaerobaculia bacterium]